MPQTAESLIRNRMRLAETATGPDAVKGMDCRRWCDTNYLWTLQCS